MTQPLDKFHDAALEDFPNNTSFNTAEEPNFDAAWSGISFSGAIKRAFQKYATFTGRASRSEFWYFYLSMALFWLIPIFGPIYVISAIIPALSLTWRRLHDIGKTGFTYVTTVAVAMSVSCLAFLMAASNTNEAIDGTNYLFMVGMLAPMALIIIPIVAVGAPFFLLLMAGFSADNGPSPWTTMFLLTALIMTISSIYIHIILARPPHEKPDAYVPQENQSHDLSYTSSVTQSAFT